MNRILLVVYAVALCLGAWDYFRGNRWKLGERFIDGIRAIEPLFLTMTGILVLVPLFSQLLNRMLPPVCGYLGMEPAVFTGLLLANDMGAFQLAHALSNNSQAADFSGMLLASVFGVNLVFTLPAALKMIAKEDHGFFYKGIMIGMCTVPLGCFLGGMSGGYHPLFLLKLLIPVLVVACLAVVALLKFPGKLSVWLGKISRCIEAVALLGLVAAIVLELLGLTKNGWLDSIHSGIAVVGSIIIVLPGAYVFIALLQKACRGLLLKIGAVLGINEIAVLGMVTALANSIPTLTMIKDMDPRGKVVNAAFLTAGAFALGDHLAYCYAVAPQLVVPLLVTKLSAACCAVVLAFLCENMQKKRG